MDCIRLFDKRNYSISVLIKMIKSESGWIQRFMLIIQWRYELQKALKPQNRQLETLNLIDVKGMNVEWII